MEEGTTRWTWMRQRNGREEIDTVGREGGREGGRASTYRQAVASVPGSL